MGIPNVTCKCIRSCRDSPNEVDLAKADYLRSKGYNLKINNNPTKLGYYKKSRIQSCLFKCKCSESKIRKEIGNTNPKEKIKEAIPPTIFEDSEENKYLETNNYPIKTVASLNNMNDKVENSIYHNNDNFEKNEINNNTNLDDYINDNSEIYKIMIKAITKIIFYNKSIFICFIHFFIIIHCIYKNHHISIFIILFIIFLPICIVIQRFYKIFFCIFQFFGDKIIFVRIRDRFYLIDF